jgi:Domain of unknown function (DUF4337)
LKSIAQANIGPPPTGRKSDILAVALTIVTIASHRTHTAAIISKSSANHAWAHYRASRMKYHNLEPGQSLVQVFGAKGGLAEAMLADTASQMQKYDKQAEDIQAEAEGDDHAAEAAEDRALPYDVGEGLLEIVPVLSSMYFISRKMMFPVIGVISGAAGALIAVSGFL